MFGYYPEAKKAIGICPLGDQPLFKVLFLAEDQQVKWRRGHCYESATLVQW